jgi:hypothetical protein
MDIIDNELKTNLASGPLTRHGFSDHLKRRIEKRIDEQCKRTSKRFALLSGVTVACLAVAALFLWSGWQNPYFLKTMEESTGIPENKTTAANKPDSHADQPLIRSALLIGLRTDHDADQSNEYSTYRSVLIAPEQNKLQKVAEGPGIFMPYKMDFWKIDTVNVDDPSGSSRVLNAVVASSKSGTAFSEKKTGNPLKLTEKLLYAGNRYVAVSQVFQTPDNHHNSRHEYVWVKELQHLADPNRQFNSPLQEAHVTLRDLFGAAADQPLKELRPVAPAGPDGQRQNTANIDGSGESWTIARKQGQWIPRLAIYESTSSNGSTGYRLRDIPLVLPDSVVSYDKLTDTWDNIQRINPAAIDAFSSPNQDIVAVVTDRDIAVYPYRGQNGTVPSSLLSLKLSPNESIVMVQWASEPYIDQWKQKAKLYLQN